MGADEAGGWQQGGKGRVPAATQEPEAESRGGLLLAESGMFKTEVKGFAGCRNRTGVPVPANHERLDVCATTRR